MQKWARYEAKRAERCEKRHKSKIKGRGKETGNVASKGKTFHEKGNLRCERWHYHKIKGALKSRKAHESEIKGHISKEKEQNCEKRQKFAWKSAFRKKWAKV